MFHWGGGGGIQLIQVGTGIPTKAYITETGDPYITETGDFYITE